MGRKRQEGNVFKDAMREGERPTRRQRLDDGDKDWHSECSCCGCAPTMHPTGLCGPCATGDADTAGGNW